jgi:hypothetical protein
MIYLNINHLPRLRALLKEARRLKKYGYKIVYEFANDVYVKRSLNDTPVKIIGENTVNAIIATL